MQEIISRVLVMVSFDNECARRRPCEYSWLPCDLRIGEVLT